MLELTLMMLIAAVLFFVLHIIFKSDELNYTSLVMSVIAICTVLKDNTLGDDMILFVIPLFYFTLMSALSITPWGKKSK